MKQLGSQNSKQRTYLTAKVNGTWLLVKIKIRPAGRTWGAPSLRGEREGGLGPRNRSRIQGQGTGSRSRSWMGQESRRS